MCVQSDRFVAGTMSFVLPCHLLETNAFLSLLEAAHNLFPFIFFLHTG